MYCAHVVPHLAAAIKRCSKQGLIESLFFIIEIFVAFPTASLSITRCIIFHSNPAIFFDVSIHNKKRIKRSKNCAGLPWNAITLVIESHAVGNATKMSTRKIETLLVPVFSIAWWPLQDSGVARVPGTSKVQSTIKCNQCDSPRGVRATATTEAKLEKQQSTMGNCNCNRTKCYWCCCFFLFLLLQPTVPQVGCSND